MEEVGLGLRKKEAITEKGLPNGNYFYKPIQDRERLRGIIYFNITEFTKSEVTCHGPFL